MTKNTVEIEKEIYLFDYLFIIWKWRYLIMTGTIISAVIAFILCYSSIKQQPMQYITSMTIQPPVKGIDSTGRFVYLDSSENIKAIVEKEMKFPLFEKLKNFNDSSLSSVCNFKADIISNSNVLKISCENFSVDESKKQMNLVVEILQEKYHQISDILHDEFLDAIDQKREEILILKAKQEIIDEQNNNILNSKKDNLSVLRNEEKVINRNISTSEKRIEELKTSIEGIDKNNKEILKQRDEILQKGIQNNDVIILFINNSIQQNMKMENNFRNLIQDNYNNIEYLKSMLFENQISIKTTNQEVRALEKQESDKNMSSTIKLDLLKIQNEMKKIENDIESFKKKNFFQNVKMLQEPTAIEISKARSVKLNVVLVSLTSLFIMIFVSFFIEYFIRYRNREIQASNE